jgi:glucose dehydrogenase
MVDVTVDFRFAKYPVKNTDDDEELELHENFNIKKPKTQLSVTAKKAGTLTFYVGYDTPYTVTVNDKAVDATYADGMLTVNVKKGTQNLVIMGTHHCVFDQKTTSISHIKHWANCTEGTEYYVYCLCGANGTETFVVGEAKGHKLEAIEAKEPTETENGNIAYWQCKVCKAYFADAEGKKELKESDVILLSIKAERDNQNMTILLIGVGVLLLACVATLLILRFKFGFFVKKKAPAEAEQTDESNAKPEEPPVEES